MPNCYECPDDKWLLVGDQCLLLETDRNDWLNSSKKCEEMGAHLAILTTTEQHVSAMCLVDISLYLNMYVKEIFHIHISLHYFRKLWRKKAERSVGYTHSTGWD